MALAIVQHKSAVQGLAVPGAITLAGAPTAGNLLILFLHSNIDTANITVDTTKWTLDTAATVSTKTFGQVLYRYVQGGDTATVPAPWTAGTSYTAYEIYEISGVTGTWGTDHEDTQATAVSGGTPTTTLTVSHTTAAANALLLTGAGQYNGSHNPTFNAGWNADETSNNNANYGSQASSSQSVVSSGTAITATVSYGGSSAPADLLMVTLAPLVPVNVNLTAVSAAGAVAGSGKEIDVTPAAVSGIATPGAFGVRAGSNIGLTGVASGGVASAPGVGIDSNVHLPSVSAVSARGVFAPASGAVLGAVAAVPSYGSFTPKTEPFAIFPVLGLMRNTPGPAISPMSNAPVVLIMPLPPSGPAPASVAFHLVGVSAGSRASTISPFRNVSVNLAAASAAAKAEAVVAA